MIINKKKKIILISVIIVLLFLITILVININKLNKKISFEEQEKQRVSQYTKLTEFKTIEEVALYLDSKFIDQKDSQQENIQYDIYMELSVKPEENGKYNRTFYEKLFQYSAYVLKYNNFNIIDEKNNITATVYCNKNMEIIEKYYINGTENYFDIKENILNAENFSSIESISVQTVSDELLKIINNNWKTNNIEIGTQDSIYRKYNIYFDEGFEIRKVDGKVFNIVFTSKYEKNIINNINIKSTKEEIIKQLGKPQFEIGNLIGYKTDLYYVFFYKEQISIYRNEEYETEKIAEIIEKYVSSQDTKKFIEELKKEWSDYDKYEYDEDYVVLQYTLKGLKIQYNSETKKGAIFYNNFKGFAYGITKLEEFINKEKDIPTNIYIENDNLILKHEIERINTLDDASSANNYKDSGILNTSTQFKISSQKVSSEGLYDIRFISIENKFPNSELRENISHGIWADDYNFIYAVNGRGIFAYNVKNQTYTTIILGQEEFIIEMVENNILYYNNTSVTISL